MKYRALSPSGTKRTSRHVRFRAVIRGIADIKHASSAPPIYEYTAQSLTGERRRIGHRAGNARQCSRHKLQRHETRAGKRRRDFRRQVGREAEAAIIGRVPENEDRLGAAARSRE